MVSKTTLIGYVGKDPETKTFDSGLEVTNVTLATSENYQDKDGEWQQNTEWHTLTFWGKSSDRAKKIKKGDLLYVDGKIVYRKSGEGDSAKWYTSINVNYFRKMPTGSDQSESRLGEPKKEQQGIDPDLPF